MSKMLNQLLPTSNQQVPVLSREQENGKETSTATATVSKESENEKRTSTATATVSKESEKRTSTATATVSKESENEKRTSTATATVSKESEERTSTATATVSNESEKGTSTATATVSKESENEKRTSTATATVSKESEKRTSIAAATVSKESEKRTSITAATVRKESEKRTSTATATVSRESVDGRYTSMNETWDLCIYATEQSKIPVPSTEVLECLRLMIKPEVTAFMKKIVDHFDSNSCSHEDQECFEVPREWSANQSSYHLTDLSNQTPSTHQSQPNLSSTSITGNKPSESQHITMRNEQVRPFIPYYPTGLQQGYINLENQQDLRRDPSGTSFSQAVSNYSNNQPELMHTDQFSVGYLNTPQQSDSEYKSLDQTPTSADQQTPRRSPRKSPRKQLQLEQKQRTEDLDGQLQDCLLKMYPGVKVQPKFLTTAVAAARKSARPGYTLCYSLIPGVFTMLELATSRGQGLTKPKQGDFRPSLDKDKCAAVKEYTVRWCKKNGKSLPTDAEMNNAFTEQVSHCRKKMKKTK